MSCWSKYSYYDYEEAYFHMQYYKCKEIGMYLLANLEDKHSKKLLKQLKAFDHEWEAVSAEDIKLLWDIKVWLMVNCNYF